MKPLASSLSTLRTSPRILRVFFAALTALNQQRPTDGQRFEGIGLGKWDFMSEQYERFVMRFTTG
jgi:hypothetical protein